MSGTQSSDDDKNQALARRRYEIMSAQDWAALSEVLHPDYVEEYPQSGERIRGLDNLRAILEHYPGGLSGEVGPMTLIEEEPKYVMTPTFNVIKVVGQGSTVTVWLRTRYPDGSDWYVVSVVTVRGDKLAKAVTFFAESFSPPDWRAGWVESIE